MMQDVMYDEPPMMEMAAATAMEETPNKANVAPKEPAPKASEKTEYLAEDGAATKEVNYAGEIEENTRSYAHPLRPDYDIYEPNPRVDFTLTLAFESAKELTLNSDGKYQTKIQFVLNDQISQF